MLNYLLFSSLDNLSNFSKILIFKRSTGSFCGKRDIVNRIDLKSYFLLQL